MLVSSPISISYDSTYVGLCFQMSGDEAVFDCTEFEFAKDAAYVFLTYNITAGDDDILYGSILVVKIAEQSLVFL